MILQKFGDSGTTPTLRKTLVLRNSGTCGEEIWEREEIRAEGPDGQIMMVGTKFRKRNGRGRGRKRKRIVLTLSWMVMRRSGDQMHLLMMATILTIPILIVLARLDSLR